MNSSKVSLLYWLNVLVIWPPQVKLFNEKRADLEEQQLHLNVGLQKIRETVEQVEELQKSLSIKRNELEEKNNMANAKLKQMVGDSTISPQTRETHNAMLDQC